MITSDNFLLAACSRLSQHTQGCTVRDLVVFLAIPPADAEVALVRLKRLGFALQARMHSTHNTQPHDVYYLTQRGLEHLHLSNGGY